MSDNNNNNNVVASNRNGPGNRSAPQGSSNITQSGFSRLAHNNHNWNRGNSSRNYKNRLIQQVKGATEALGHNIFDCSTRKSLEGCNEMLKQIAIYVGKEYGRSTDMIKYVVENGEDPNLDEPEDISEEEQKNKLHFSGGKRKLNVSWITKNDSQVARRCYTL